MSAVIRPLLLRAVIVAAPACLLGVALSLASTRGTSAPLALDAQTFDAAIPEVSFPDASKPDVKMWDVKFDAKPNPFDTKSWGDVHLDVRDEVAKPIPPDPTPLACDSVFVLTVKWDKGALTLDRARHEKLATKMVLPRKFGRFAAELYVGPTLLERLRFDIPLLSDDDLTSAAYAKGLVTTVDVRVPDSERPTRLEIWDRATDQRWVYPYPPKLTP